MIAAVMVVWGFWLFVILLMAFWRRSWVPLIAIPVIITGVVWLLYQWVPTFTFWIVISFHGFLFILIVGVAVFGRKEGDDPLFKRPPID